MLAVGPTATSSVLLPAKEFSRHGLVDPDRLPDLLAFLMASPDFRSCPLKLHETYWKQREEFRTEKYLYRSSSFHCEGKETQSFLECIIDPIPTPEGPNLIRSIVRSSASSNIASFLQLAGYRPIYEMLKVGHCFLQRPGGIIIFVFDLQRLNEFGNLDSAEALFHTMEERNLDKWILEVRKISSDASDPIERELEEVVTKLQRFSTLRKKWDPLSSAE